jgi:ParB family transcriptional regulator, chromosome partitioning protein
MARRPGLGRGLDALIPGNEEKSQQTPQGKQGVLQVSINDIQPNPQQPRTTISDENLKELADSIQEHGIIQPLIVSQEEGQDGYFLIAGERRWRAAKIAGLSHVPAILRTVTEQQQLEIALIENVQRSDLTPLETAEAYRQLVEHFSLTHAQIAERVGKSRVSVTNTLRLLNLSKQAQKALNDGEISEGHARAILGLSTTKAQNAALNTVLNLGLSVRQTEALIKKLSGEKTPPKPKPESSPQIKALESQLRHFFGTKVNLNNSKKGGSVVIYYYSDEELNTILEKILPESS